MFRHFTCFIFRTKGAKQNSRKKEVKFRKETPWRYEWKIKFEIQIRAALSITCTGSATMRDGCYHSSNLHLHTIPIRGASVNSTGSRGRFRFYGEAGVCIVTLFGYLHLWYVSVLSLIPLKQNKVPMHLLGFLTPRLALSTVYTITICISKYILKRSSLLNLSLIPLKRTQFYAGALRIKYSFCPRLHPFEFRTFT